MKKYLLIFALFGLIACENKANIEVPENVKKAFTEKYPGATNPQWEQQPYGYEAVFVQNGIEYEGEFSPQGTWLETEYEVPQQQFSSQVLARVKRENPGYTVTKHEIEITPQGKFYEVEIERGSEQIELYFDESANPAPNSNEDA